MLQINQLEHAFGNTRLTYPDWEVAQNNHAMILGSSGSGKTTLLHLIGGLMTPMSGQVIVSGKDLSTLSGGNLDKFRGKNIGIVFQKPHLIKSLTVAENLRLAQTLGGSPKNAEHIDMILERLSIAELKKRKVYQISQGQAQRVSIARAVINEPKLLLADEPTASLDDENCSRVIELLKEQANSNDTTLIVATHDQRVKGEFENQLSL